MTFYPITPVPKPRMTQSDKWNKRPEVVRYHAFKDEVKLRRVTLPEAYHVIFYMPMPASWSKNKRAAMEGMQHQQPPDKDNLEKALLDSVYVNDSHVWDGRVTKIWAVSGGIEIIPIEPFPTPHKRLEPCG